MSAAPQGPNVVRLGDLLGLAALLSCCCRLSDAVDDRVLSDLIIAAAARAAYLAEDAREAVARGAIT